MSFQAIAPYLQDPLILTGFVLLLFFGLGRTLLKAGIIPVLTRSAGYRIVARVLLYGFVLSLAVIAVSFFLKYQELSEQEQRAAVRLLREELAGNINVAQELSLNTETILNAVGIVSEVLRHPDIPLLLALFPNENLNLDAEVGASLDFARERLQSASWDGLLDNQLERDRFLRAGTAISGTISRTLSTIESLSDIDESRYVISSEAWEANLPILRKVNIIDTSQMQALYLNLDRLRTNYGIVVAHCIEYLRSIREFFDAPELVFSEQALADVLAAERLFLATAISYASVLEESIVEVNETRIRLDELLGASGEGAMISD